MKRRALILTLALLAVLTGCQNDNAKAKDPNSESEASPTLQAQGKGTTDWRSVSITSTDKCDAFTVHLKTRWLPSNINDETQAITHTPSFRAEPNERLDMVYLRDYYGAYQEPIDTLIDTLSKDPEAEAIQNGDFKGWIKVSQIIVPDQSTRKRMSVQAVLVSGQSAFSLSYYGNGDPNTRFEEFKHVAQSFTPSETTPSR